MIHFDMDCLNMYDGMFFFVIVMVLLCIHFSFLDLLVLLKDLLEYDMLSLFLWIFMNKLGLCQDDIFLQGSNMPF